MSYLRPLFSMVRSQATLRAIVVLAAVGILTCSAAIYADEPTTAPAVPAATTAPATPAAATPPATAPAEDNSAVKMVQPGAFDIHARDLDLRLVLQMLSQQGQKNIVATKEVSGKLSADLYGVTFHEALDAVLRATGFAYEEKGNFVYVYTPDQLDKIHKAERKVGVETLRMHYITATDARTLLTPALSQDGNIAITPAAGMGITASKTDTGGNSYATEDVLVVRDYEENLAKIRKIAEEIDIRPEQVLIESTILQATLDENNALGVDFNVLAGINFQDIGSSTNGVEDLTKGKLDASGIANHSNMGAVRTDFAASVPQGGVSFGFISDNVAVFVRALENITPTTVLANPKLLVVNKQRGEVLVGSHDGYLTTTVTETVATQTVQFLDTGTRLIVRPYIGKDGFIRMEIHPEDSSGGVVPVGQNALPKQQTTEVTSNIMVRDGRTIVIGGLFRDETKSSHSQVPVVGNLPVLGALFRSTADTIKRQEIIILITPHIIKHDADEITSEQLKDETERFRVGQRKWLQCWGHDRLSEAYIRSARHEYSEGDMCGALWKIDMALSMSPQNAEAIEFKERLTGKAYWYDEPRSSNANYIIQRLIMNELGKPFEPVVAPEKPLNTGRLPEDVRKALGIDPRVFGPMNFPEGGCHLKCCDPTMLTPEKPVKAPETPVKATEKPSGGLMRAPTTQPAPAEKAK